MSPTTTNLSQARVILKFILVHGECPINTTRNALYVEEEGILVNQPYRYHRVTNNTKTTVLS